MYDTAGLYKLLKAKDGAPHSETTFIWKNAAPPRVQLFIWFLTQWRIQGQINLHRKKTMDSDL